MSVAAGFRQCQLINLLVPQFPSSTSAPTKDERSTFLLSRLPGLLGTFILVPLAVVAPSPDQKSPVSIKNLEGLG